MCPTNNIRTDFATGCHDSSFFKCYHLRTRNTQNNSLNVKKTDCCSTIMSRNSGATVDELPSPPCFSPALIGAGLFTKMERKEQGGQMDRNPFVSRGCDYLHGDEGPECSALFRCESQTIEPVFVLPREVWGAQKRGEEEEERGGRQQRGLRIVRATHICFCYCGGSIAFQYQGF